jgi:GntR family transcriptional regulator
LSVNPNSHVPIFRQIAQHIRTAIAAGAYQPGDLLPSQRALALEMVVNPNTVQRAYEELEREGLVYTRKGVGLFVADRGGSSARSSSRSAVTDALAEAIRSGLAAGLSTQDIRSIFESASEQAARAPARRASHPKQEPPTAADGAKPPHAGNAGKDGRT